MPGHVITPGEPRAHTDQAQVECALSERSESKGALCRSAEVELRGTPFRLKAEATSFLVKA